ncbi:MAG TPA: hypothetical protein VFV99_32115 [Kofleriaceae bacterium]|nr:hypothetical protein [Kofleriaceae bacterium]
MSSLRYMAVIVVATTSCKQSAEVPRVRYANAAPVTVVNDRRAVPTRPHVSRQLLDLDFYDRSVEDPLMNTLSLPQKQRARGVNAVDEVPNSTWFTNRIGVRDMSPQEIANGPLGDEGPEPHKPWTVHSTKPGGTEVGFIITDARGVKYGLGFDTPEWPEMETGNAVVVNRLLWAFGYNVPDERIAYIRPEDLVPAANAQVKDSQGRRLRQLDRKELDRQLALVSHAPDGRIRVLASRWLSGESLGGTNPTGVRKGDPNDVIPHEDRRDLRGQYPVFAWLEHLDLVRGNFLDMLIAPHDPAHRYVVHYLLDFGRSLGAIAVIDKNLRANHRYLVDWSDPIWTFGTEPRSWGKHAAPLLTGVSPTFVATGFDPGAWKPNLPYQPFDSADRFDMFWGTKILGRFTPEQIRAAVEAGRFSDPRTVDYLTDTLIRRQQATMAYWYVRVNPLDKFTVGPNGLCFEDLAMMGRLVPGAPTRYELASYDRDARPLGTVTINAAQGGATCTGSVKLSNVNGGYTIVKITTLRPVANGSTIVHLARAPKSAEWRVIGVMRV